MREEDERCARAVRTSGARDCMTRTGAATFRYVAFEYEQIRGASPWYLSI